LSNKKRNSNDKSFKDNNRREIKKMRNKNKSKQKNRWKKIERWKKKRGMLSFKFK